MTYRSVSRDQLKALAALVRATRSGGTVYLIEPGFETATVRQR